METEKRLTRSTSAKALAWRKDYYFDPRAARRFIAFATQRCRHTQGAFAGQPFIPERWQYKIFRRLFGWKRRANGTRKFRRLFIFIAKKNGKSLMGAIIALYLLHADKEPAARICSVAADAKNAHEVFDTAKQMNRYDAALSVGSVSYRQSLVVHKTASRYEVISSVADTKHGPSWHGILFDEVHTQPSRELYETLRKGTAARSQPLEVYMTTAGNDPNSLCFEMYEYAKAVAAGTIDDPGFYPVIFECAEDDDWRLESTWKKANPSYGVTVTKEYFEQQVLECINQPKNLNSFLRLHLNRWTTAVQKAVDMELWRECGKIEFDPSALLGTPCWLGLDLASKSDLCALARVFRQQDKLIAMVTYWCPEESMKKRTQREKERWEGYVREGHIRVVPGGRNDFGLVRNEILEACKLYDVKEVCADPWNAHQLITELETQYALTVVEVRQGVFTLSEPTKELISVISEKKFVHFDNPVLAWNAGNMATIEDSNGNIRPDKKRSSEKIDGMVAIVTAMARVLVHADEPASVYDDPNVLVALG